MPMARLMISPDALNNIVSERIRDLAAPEFLTQALSLAIVQSTTRTACALLLRLGHEGQPTVYPSPDFQRLGRETRSAIPNFGSVISSAATLACHSANPHYRRAVQDPFGVCAR